MTAQNWLKQHIENNEDCTPKVVLDYLYRLIDRVSEAVIIDEFTEEMDEDNYFGEEKESANGKNPESD